MVVQHPVVLVIVPVATPGGHNGFVGTQRLHKPVIQGVVTPQGCVGRAGCLNKLRRVLRKNIGRQFGIDRNIDVMAGRSRYISSTRNAPDGRSFFMIGYPLKV